MPINAQDAPIVQRNRYDIERGKVECVDFIGLGASFHRPVNTTGTIISIVRVQKKLVKPWMAVKGARRANRETCDSREEVKDKKSPTPLRKESKP